jgi:hypothetical protein
MRRLDDRGSMPLALLVVTIGMAMSGTLAAMVITQVQTGDFDARRLQALHAAQAGLDVGLAAVRGAVDSAGVGDTALLPCGPLEGPLGEGSTASYVVTINYYGKDPQGKPWTQDPQGNPVPPTDGFIACADAQAKNPGPAFVMFDSVGSAVKGSTAERELRGTYVVHTDNSNISGGLIHFPSASKDLCFDAGSAEPASGTPLTVQLCNAGGTSQTWAYAETLQFVLVASQTPAHPFGMCLDAGGYPRLVPSATVIIPVLLQPCQSVAPALYRQMWSFNDSGNLVGSNATGTNTDGYCFNVPTPDTANIAVILTKSCNAFAEDANVGAGQAASQEPGKYVGQLINYNQFGRCLDDTGQNRNAAFMIAWPCKQNPNPTLVTWNQRNVVPVLPSVADPTKDGTDDNHVTGTIVMTWPNPGTAAIPATGTTPAIPAIPASSDAYCLQSPLSPELYQYVTTKVCDGTASQQWTVYGHTAHYATSYTIVDSTGLYCLQPRDPTTATPDLYATVNLISKIYVGVCSGSTLQKWNADKNVVDSTAVKDVGEIPKKTD